MIASKARPVVVAGQFDGVHVGHRRLVTVALALAAEAGGGVVALVVDDDAGGRYLASARRRCELLVHAGVATATVVPVTRHQHVDVQLRRVLVGLNPVAIGFEQEIRVAVRNAVRSCLPSSEVLDTPTDRLAGSPVTSGVVATLIADGAVDDVVSLLGRPFEIEGTIRNVGRSSTQSRPFFMPVAVDARLVMPRPGDYAAHVRLQQRSVDAVVRVDDAVSVLLLRPLEVHVTDAITLALIKRLPSDQKNVESSMP